MLGEPLFSLSQRESMMQNRDEVAYAMAHTTVLYVPDRRIDTFGDTRFNYRLVAEDMDAVGVCRIRSGWVEAARPRILRPADLRGIEMEGFSGEAKRFFEWMERSGAPMPAFFKYGFRFSRSEVAIEEVHDDIRNVEERVVQEALNSGDSLRAVIRGVDDAWELSLLRFMMEMIQNSHEINTFDFRRRGLL